ncbi:MAG: hypothetical protein IPJ46_16695 [Anaerolineales bacterium]|nr:hypothetical protein [Anaerolineales bacterium]
MLRLHSCKRAFAWLFNQDKLREITLNTDVACGTLAIHRNNMEEAWYFKVREALALGVPLILAYHDTDLSS